MEIPFAKGIPNTRKKMDKLNKKFPKTYEMSFGHINLWNKVV